MVFNGTVLLNKHIIKFYRRATEDEKHSLEEFLKSIKRENMAWDAPTETLYYKDTGGKLYKVVFEPVTIDTDDEE